GDGSGDLVLPLNAPQAGTLTPGYFVLGPNQIPFPDATPVSYQSKFMSYRGAPFDPQFDPQTGGATTTVLLQRLASPGLPANPFPGQPGYQAGLPPNPYVTVDYMDEIPVGVDGQPVVSVG